LVIRQNAGSEMTIRKEAIPDMREDLKKIIEEMK
jgi:hypothetical protein